jgi:hypothetical protein
LVERWAVFTEEGEMLFETKKEAIEAAEQREIYTISSYYG